MVVQVYSTVLPRHTWLIHYVLIKTSTQLGYSCRKEREKQLSEFAEQLQARRLVCHTLASALELSSCCSFTLLYICPTLQSTSLSALIASIFTSRKGNPQSFCASEWTFCARHRVPKQSCFTQGIVRDTELNRHKQTQDPGGNLCCTPQIITTSKQNRRIEVKKLNYINFCSKFYIDLSVCQSVSHWWRVNQLQDVLPL